MFTDSAFLNFCIYFCLGLFAITALAGLVGYIAKRIAIKRGHDVADSHPRGFIHTKGVK